MRYDDNWRPARRPTPEEEDAAERRSTRLLWGIVVLCGLAVGLGAAWMRGMPL